MVLGEAARVEVTAIPDCVFTGAVCPTPGGSVERAYKYIGDSVVSTD